MHYNLYYNGFKVNNRPLTEEQLEEVRGYENIYKRNPITNKIEAIPSKKLKLVETIII